MAKYEAGPDLDALIAERVFGLKVDWEFDRPRALALRDQYDEMGWLPPYSTDWGAAGQVVEHITAEDGPYADAKWSFGLEYSNVVDWVADFTPRRHHPQSRNYGAFQRSADTAPLAICRAALAALDTPPA